MNYLLIRSESPTAQLKLYKDFRLVEESAWVAQRTLSDTIHLEIDQLLNKAGLKLSDLSGVGVYSGPGSFTGLRIGHAVANAFAFSLKIPVVGANGGGWEELALKRLKSGDDDKVALPIYGAPPRTTKPRK